MMEVTLKGDVVQVEGTQPEVGQVAPDFSLVNLSKKIVQLSDLKGQPVVVSVVPDINTSVCQLQTKRFNQEMAKLPEVQFLTISNNTKEEQENWCAAEGVGMEMLHDTELKFGKLYGLHIPAIDKLARAIFVLDAQGKIIYREITPEISQEPDYEKVLEILK